MTATTMKPTMANLTRLATQHGATVDCHEANGEWQLYVDLPAGKVIMGAHGNCWSADKDDEYFDGTNYAAAKRHGIAQAIEWLGNAIEDGCECSDPTKCDVCNPE